MFLYYLLLSYSTEVTGEYKPEIIPEMVLVVTYHYHQMAE